MTQDQKASSSPGKIKPPNATAVVLTSVQVKNSPQTNLATVIDNIYKSGNKTEAEETNITPKAALRDLSVHPLDCVETAQLSADEAQVEADFWRKQVTTAKESLSNIEAKHTDFLEGRGEVSIITHEPRDELEQYRDKKLVITETIMFAERQAARMQERAGETKEEAKAKGEATKAKGEATKAIGEASKAKAEIRKVKEETVKAKD